MSYDEARRGFQYDAPANTASNYYLLVGDNAYGYSTSGTNFFGMAQKLKSSTGHFYF